MTMKDLHSYGDSVNYLYSLRKGGIKLGLSNTFKLLHMLGNPQRCFHSVHIAGTNGKGSTAAFIASILKESGISVGLYTSPHLISFTERIRINGTAISEENVRKLTKDILRRIDGTDLKPTFFEFVTAMAFHYFRLKETEWAVVETGMGGRFDATNVLEPEISVVTDISIDHTEYLGETLAQVTAEKAGIIKPRVPVVTAATSDIVTAILSDTADRCASEMHIYNRDYHGSILSMNDHQLIFNYRGFRNYHGVLSPLIGKHQMYNAAMAIRTCEIVKRGGVPITDTSIMQGISNMRLDGRLEKVSDRPHIILDSAHNPGSAMVVAETIKKILPSRKIILVVGIMKDKDVRGVLAPLIEISDTIILTAPPDERAETPGELHKHILQLHSSKDLSQISIYESGSVAEALTRAQEEWRDGHVILVTGSFYTTGAAKEALGSTGVLSGLRE